MKILICYNTLGGGPLLKLQRFNHLVKSLLACAQDFSALSNHEEHQSSLKEYLYRGHMSPDCLLLQDESDLNLVQENFELAGKIIVLFQPAKKDLELYYRSRNSFVVVWAWSFEDCQELLIPKSRHIARNNIELLLPRMHYNVDNDFKILLISAGSTNLDTTVQFLNHVRAYLPFVFLTVLCGSEERAVLECFSSFHIKLQISLDELEGRGFNICIASEELALHSYRSKIPTILMGTHGCAGLLDSFTFEKQIASGLKGRIGGTFGEKTCLDFLLSEMNNLTHLLFSSKPENIKRILFSDQADSCANKPVMPTLNKLHTISGILNQTHDVLNSISTSRFETASDIVVSASDKDGNMEFTHLTTRDIFEIAGEEAIFVEALIAGELNVEQIWENIDFVKALVQNNILNIKTVE